MISIGRVREADYYLAEVFGDDAFAYYEDLQRAGVWTGSLSAQLGLSGPVDAEDFRAALDGIDPTTGQPLTATRVGTHALDVTLSVPKSYGIVWALGDAETRAQLDAAIDDAQAAVIDLVERHATKVRRGHAGAELHPGSGLMVAAFAHTTSRLADPQPHRHLVVFNVTAGPDGRRTALATRELYATRYAAEAVFQAQLRAATSRTVGLLFDEVDRHGSAEVAGIPIKVRRAFSRRRADIEAEMATRGVVTGHGARIATLATRTAKNRNQPPDEVLRIEWRKRAADLGFDIRDVPTRRREPQLDVTDETLASRATEDRAYFRHIDAVRHVASAADQGADLEDVLARTSAFLASPQAIPITDSLWTTPEILALEQTTVDIATRGQHIGAGLVTLDSVERALALRSTIADEQADLVRRVAASGNRINLVIGKAGAGKTFSLDALRDAYETDGYRVIGAALSARAAGELQSGAGIRSETVHRRLAAIDSGRLTLDDRTLVVIDESGMLGTRLLARVIAEANRAGATVLLVGDPKQLPEVEAGGLFAALANRLDVIHLTENRRQRDPIERAALDELRAGHVDPALGRLHRAGNITLADNADTLRDTLVADWHDARVEGRHAVMVAARRSDAADLNQRARALLAEAGTLGDTVLRLDSGDFAIGDRILCHRNRYDDGLVNGDLGTITGATDHGLTVQLDTGRHVTVPHDYLDDGHLTHGYALTVHKAQGMTCDDAFLLGDDALFAELGYTGLSRGRHHNHLYAVASRDELGHDLDDPLADIRRALHTSHAQTAAIDLIDPHPLNPQGAPR